MLEDLTRERGKKLKELRTLGVNPYPARTKRNFSLKEALDNWGSLERAAKLLYLVGRIRARRDQGGIIFLDLDDGSASLQAVISKANFREFDSWRERIDVGDFIEVRGRLFKTKRGEKSVEVRGLKLLTKTLRPLPNRWFGLKDTEERFRKRYLDIIFNPEVKGTIEKRSELIREMREFLWAEGFMEVETPMLQPIPGGALARPFQTHHNALDADFYLRIAPELYLKRLLVAGFNKIFEIGRVFRNEGIDREHNPEFTMLELYAAYCDGEWMIKFTEHLLQPFLKVKWQRMTYKEALAKYAKKKVDFLNLEGVKLDELFKREVRSKLIKPVIIYDYPKSISPLAKSKDDEPRLTERFQFIIEGMEIANGFSELNDPLDQRERMEDQERRYRRGEEAGRMDEEFLEALEYGMPPSAGLGVGIDRLVAIVSGRPSIKESIIFPTLRPKNGSVDSS